MMPPWGRGKPPDQAVHLFRHLVGREVLHFFLDIDTGGERHLSPRFLRSLRIRPGLGLLVVQDIHTAADELRNVPLQIAAGVHVDRHALFMDEAEQPCIARREQIPPQIHGEQRAALHGLVVKEDDAVQPVGGVLADDAFQIGKNAVQQQLDMLRLQQQLHQIVFKAEQVFQTVHRPEAEIADDKLVPVDLRELLREAVEAAGAHGSGKR